MTLEEFLNKRKNKEFTIEEIESILKDLGYETELVETYCKPNIIGAMEQRDNLEMSSSTKLGRLTLHILNFTLTQINRSML